ncbi:MAG: hypothetical protein UV04_C0020G0017 [Candidatus Gottesmanbacteria bacterium GW2011_GWA2_42_16]|nr:MAG: hypothetical protein UV04_C0020G0017 [Candidatus Gottesmanbacteria bacterium GW2011_GWA2_42_16]
MFEFLILAQFISALVTLVVGVGFITFFRKRADNDVKENKAAGFWVRAICLGTDAAIIDLLLSLVAYRGTLAASGHVTILVTLAYFFFFWLFFRATPAMILARIKIVSQDGQPLTVWQVTLRLMTFIFLFIGWIPLLFDKKEKKALHDLVSKTRVVFTEKTEKSQVDKWVPKLKFVLLGLTIALLIGLIVVDTFKYDLNNDRVVDLTTFDADKDGVAESLDINNDGRIDGFDFDNDNILDVKVADGQNAILLRKVLFGVGVAGFVSLLVFTIIKENKFLNMITGKK